MVQLAGLDRRKREALAKQLLSGGSAPSASSRRSSIASASAAPSAAAVPSGLGKIVYRHLGDGDLMLTNRQVWNTPKCGTLHTKQSSITCSHPYYLTLASSPHP